MALDLTISITAIDSDCDTITVTDGTGTYDVNDNPGGYGAPNTERANLGLYLFGYEYNPDGDDSLLTVDNTNPTGVTGWNIDVSGDGYVYFILLAVPVWDAGTTYAIGDIVEASGVFYRSLTAGNLNNAPAGDLTNWEVLTDATLIANYTSAANITAELQTRDDDVIVCNSEKGFAQEVSKAAAGTCCSSCQTANRWERMNVLLQAAYVQLARNQFTKAHTLVKQIEREIVDAKCASCGT
jgi:hypothetical protein